ncbi:MAG: hypothetical protein ACREKG_16340, partial [Candidatus Rokuibacteriota bacterium]
GAADQHRDAALAGDRPGALLAVLAAILGGLRGRRARPRWVWAFGVLGRVALAGPLAVGFKDFSPRKTGV